MLPDEAAVRFDQVTKRYGRTTALDRCAFSVPAGSVTAVVGPNGAGKSTLLSLVARVTAPTAGRVEVAPVGARPARVRYLTQDRPLYPGLTVADTLRVVGRLNQVWSQERAVGWLDRFHVPLGQRCRDLSGGQRTHVALAACLGARPDVLLLDEPLANLDPLARRDTVAHLLDLVALDGMTVLLATHVLTEIAGVADRLLLVAGGRTLLSGDIDSLLAEHRLITAPSEANPPSGVQVVVSRSNARATEALARLVAPDVVPHPLWRQAPVSIEELVLGYLESEVVT